MTKELKKAMTSDSTGDSYPVYEGLKLLDWIAPEWVTDTMGIKFDSENEKYVKE